MCGIFGLVSSNNNKNFKKLIAELFKLSESRGKEASGVVFRSKRQIRYIKTPLPATQLIASKAYNSELNLLLSQDGYNVAIGHSRLVTHGNENNDKNNQPVVAHDHILTHNGIVVNYKDLWRGLKESAVSSLDSEVLLAIIKDDILKGRSLVMSISKLFNKIEGTASCAILPQYEESLILFSNNGSLYYCQSKDKKSFIYASERYILNKIVEKSTAIFEKEKIVQLLPLNILRLSLLDMSFNLFSKEKAVGESPSKKEKKLVKALKVEYDKKIPNIQNTSLRHISKSVPKNLLKVVDNRIDNIKSLKRCRKCILPETFPFISFDKKGVCSVCKSYVPPKLLGSDMFAKKMEQYKTGSKQKHDCLIPFSGGRDSSFTLHYVVKELGLNPISFSYDWGMLTNLARRNQARICGALGVEHILVSADIRKKRRNIRSNVSAWLKRPHLGTIPLFMAGDKQYFYYSQLISSQNQIKISVMGENNLEKTGFKTGFAGIKPPEDGIMSYDIGLKEKTNMLLFYASQYMLNPSYINSSLVDTVKAFLAYYTIKHNHINIFDYLPWNEDAVEKTIIEGYDWETDPETKSTWRIGDGTTAFYNYIYYMVAGFTENDTFRSNQIREGSTSREEALYRCEIENHPRWDSIKWYCNTIDLNWENVIKLINKMPILFPH